MKNISGKVGYLILNIQLLFGFSTSYGYLNRHLIVTNVIFFILAAVIFSNVIFFIFRRIKYIGINSFISIAFASVLMALITLKINKPEIELRPIDYALVMGYLIVILKLYITTPIVLIIEILLKKKYKF
ncbi:hypothetical protein ACDX34_06300 [Acinetobacter bereziniae]|uniref:hypothetical protein n=1 Tax=Acinetobacter bereziniae TaxID=106648 RepID=UPI000B1D0067|nr:hypothetical protein [Acinetobacter bereziniae]